MKFRKYTIIPLKGTEELKFGSTRDFIKSEFSELYEGTFKREDNEVDDYGFFHAYFDNNKLCAVEFFEPCKIYFESFQLMGQNSEKCKSLFMQYDKDLSVEENVGFTSVKLQIGVYAPYGKTEAVLVAKDGYYQ